FSPPRPCTALPYTTLFRSRTPVCQHRLDQLVALPFVLQGQRRDRAVSTGSEETLVQARGERGKQLPLAHAPRRGPAHHRLRPVAHRAAEEFRPVEERLYDVGNATHAHHADKHE